MYYGFVNYLPVLGILTDYLKTALKCYYNISIAYKSKKNKSFSSTVNIYSSTMKYMYYRVSRNFSESKI